MSVVDPPSSMTGWLVSNVSHLRQMTRKKVGRDLLTKVALSDIVNDVWFKSWKDRHKFRGTTDAERFGWLRRIFLNHVANTRRSIEAEARNPDREQAIPEGVELAGEETSAIDQMMEEERNRAIRAAVADLPYHYQIVIDLRSYQKLSFPEIATQLGLTTDAATKLYARAVLRLKAELGSEFDPCR